MSLHCLGKAGYPTNSSSPFQLHGSPNTNSSLCSTQIGKLPDLHSGHEDALSLSWNLCIDFDKVERCGRAQGWEPLRGRALQWQRLGELQNHKKIDIFRIDLCEFLLSCCVHSHSRAQVSISLSSMEAEILAATSLLVGGIQLKLKQLLQFLLGDNGGLSNNSKVQMWLRLDSTTAQGFFNRLGPGRAKHLSTRMMWSQQAMRKRWFLVERISTKRILRTWTPSHYPVNAESTSWRRLVCAAKRLRRSPTMPRRWSKLFVWWLQCSWLDTYKDAMVILCGGQGLWHLRGWTLWHGHQQQGGHWQQLRWWAWWPTCWTRSTSWRSRWSWRRWFEIKTFDLGLRWEGNMRVARSKHQLKLPVVLHKAVAEVSKIGNL